MMQHLQHISSKLVVLFLIIFFGISTSNIFAQSIRQADYYVDGLTGNNSNNGLTPQTAKLNIAGITALGSAIAGRTIAFRDSLYYRGTWTISESNVTVTNYYEDGSDQLPVFTPSLAVTNFTNVSGNVWQASAGSASAVWLMYPNRDSCVWGIPMSSQGALAQEGQYFISGSTMYLYAPSDPDNFYQSVNRASGSNGIQLNGTNNKLSYIEVFGAVQFPLLVAKTATNSIIEYSSFHHCGMWADMIAGGGSGHSAGVRGNNSILRHSKFWEGSNHGVHLYAYDQNISGVIIEYCAVYNNHHTGIDLNSPGSDVTDNIFRYNYVYETEYARERAYIQSGSRQVGIWQQGSMAKNNTYAYNLIVNNGRGNMSLNGTGNQFYNNTSIHTVTASGGNSFFCYSNGGTARNNIAYHVTSGRSISGFSTTSNNINYSAGSGTNPLFVNISNGMATHLIDAHLQASSPAIDYGTDVGYSFDMEGNPIVGNPDAGVYEYTAGGGGNNPPNVPSSPNPSNGSANQPLNLTLSWSCSDPDGDPLTYDVYFGTNSNPPVVSTNQSNTNYNPGQLINSTTYYWKIVAKDNQGASRTSPVWNFSTLAGPDITPPQVVSAALQNLTTLKIIFSEPLEQSGALNINNYSITNGIVVFSATITSSEVTLTTSEHSEGTYTVNVNNVTDLAGNTIDPNNNSAEYESVPTQLSRLEIVEATASVVPEPEHTPEKTIDGLGYYHGDPDSRWSGDTMPEWMMFDLGSVKIINLLKLSFYNWNGGRLYTYSVETSNDLNQWTVVLTNATSSTVEWTEDIFNSIQARYLRVYFIASNQNSWAGLWETEIWGTSTVSGDDDENFNLITDYSLNQNYPNPFNPSTIISFSLPTDSQVKLSVYNLLGEQIAELLNSHLSAGVHTVSFNSEGITSGIYLYRLEANEFISTKKMILLK